MKNGIIKSPLVLLSSESPHEYRKHVAGLLASLQPRDYYETCLVQEFADAAWVWRRARAVESSHLHQIGTSYYRGPQGIAEALFYTPEKQLRNHRRYMLDAERRYEQARRTVDYMHRRREQGSAATVPDSAEPLRPERATPLAAVAAQAATAKKRNEPAVARQGLQVIPLKGDPGRESPARNEPKCLRAPRRVAS